MDHKEHKEIIILVSIVVLGVLCVPHNLRWAKDFCEKTLSRQIKATKAVIDSLNTI